MKTKQILSLFLVLVIAILFTNCTETPDLKSATVSIKAVSTKSVTKGVNIASGNLVVDNAIVQIEKIVLEDNTGEGNNNDVSDGNEKDNANDTDTIQNENEGDHQDGDQNENDDKNEKKDKNDSGDLVLAGPYSLDISSGFASIGDISVAPATYKKVDFNFVDGTTTGVNSINLSGTYTNDAGTATPFKLVYNSSDALQLPLADSGLVVTTGSTVTLSIVFDVNTWLSGLDFASAEISNGSIEISASKNTTLYNAFVAALSENIDVED